MLRPGSTAARESRPRVGGEGVPRPLNEGGGVGDVHVGVGVAGGVGRGDHDGGGGGGDGWRGPAHIGLNSVSVCLG